MLEAGISGRVVVEFVVDSSGMVEPESVVALETTDSLFTQSVRDALVRARFTPARIGSRPVRQVMQLPFTFSPPPKR
jgi:TonB family protein